MKRISVLFVLSLVIIGMTGCAPKMSPPSPYAKKGYTSNPQKSFARNVIKSAGLDDIKDISSEEMSKAFDGKARSENLGASIFATLNYISDLNQLGLATLPLSFFSWNYVFGSKKADQRAYPKVYAWMPKALAETPEEAIDIMRQILLNNLRKGLNDVEFSPPYKVEATPVELLPRVSKSIEMAKQEVFKVYGGKCGDKKDHIKCHYGFNYMIQAFMDKKIFHPYPGISPDFLGAKDVWAFTARSIFRFYRSFSLKKGEPDPSLPDLKVYQATSKYLPEWIYIYLPNSQKSHLILANGQPLPMPVVLNQGKIHLFVKPDKC